MKLTVQLKLQPTPEQADALKRTLEAAKAACDSISQVAIHKLTYQMVREQFGLAAQLTNRFDLLLFKLLGLLLTVGAGQAPGKSTVADKANTGKKGTEAQAA